MQQRQEKELREITLTWQNRARKVGNANCPQKWTFKIADDN